jgi:hypothetical protein
MGDLLDEPVVGAVLEGFVLCAPSDRSPGNRGRIVIGLCMRYCCRVGDAARTQ